MKLKRIFLFAGKWFEIERYQQHDEIEDDCASITYSWSFATNSYRTTRTGKDLLNNQTTTRDGTAVLAFPKATPRDAILNVTYADKGLMNLKRKTNKFL